MFARIGKTIVTAIVASVAIASTGFGAIFLTALVQVMSGNVPETATASSPEPGANPVVEKEAVETKNTFDFTVVQSQGLENSTVPQAIDYADYVAQEPDTNKRYVLAHKAIKCDLTISSLSLEDKSYLKFLTVILAARAPQESSGNNRYFMAKNFVRYMPEKGKEILALYAGIMCASPTESPTSTQPIQENWVTMGETSGGETLVLDTGSVQNKPHAGDWLWFSYSVGGRQRVGYTGSCVGGEVAGIQQWFVDLEGDQLAVKASSAGAKALLSKVCQMGSSSTGGYTPEEAQLEAQIVQSTATNCKDLKAQGYSNIQVWANPDLAKLDRDKDGIACESK